MASTSSATIADKPSFAKIAAMPPPQKIVRISNAQSKVTDLQKDHVHASPATTSSSSPPVAQVGTAKITNPDQVIQDVAAVAHVVEQLDLKSEPPLSLAPVAPSTETVPVAHGIEDEQSHLSGSSTKPPSFDTKSMASENTFGMDEKESLRPDDSASVQAADEDEPFFVPPSLARPDPQMALYGSNQGSRRPLLGPAIPIGPAGRRFPMAIMANPPRFGDIIPAVPAGLSPESAPINSFPANLNGVDSMQSYSASPVPPDEKLLEAMETPKDRLLLLQLEEKFLAFLAQSKDVTLDLPPQNSYERLLAHKLADYYSLSRYTSADGNAIRLYKSVELRVPIPLSELVRGIVGNDSLAPGASAVKIMRRAAFPGNKILNDGSTAASSSIPSKATSETGVETVSDEGMPSPDTASSKDRSKWTRDEKEAHYKAARERIFRDFQEAHASEAMNADNSVPISRPNSSNGKKKGHRQRAPKDDSFEARSSYVPGYFGMPYTTQNQSNGFGVPSDCQSTYGAPNPQAAPTMPFNSNAAPPYHQYDSSTMFPTMNYSSAYLNQYGSNDAWSNPQSPQPSGYYNFVQQPAAGYSPYGSGISSPANHYPQMISPGFHSPNQQWGQTQYQQQYPGPPLVQPSITQNGPPAAWSKYSPYPNVCSPGSPYQFVPAQFQQHASAPTTNNQHPLPGSYNRPVFNPQIRSFVPSGPNMRFGGQVPPFAAAAGNGNSNSNSNQYVEYSDVGARNAAAALHKAQESLQKKWGTPAHLPKKPPPSQMPSTFEVENTPPAPSQKPFSPPVSSISNGSVQFGNGNN